jgi:hypothetical protein
MVELNGTPQMAHVLFLLSKVSPLAVLSFMPGENSAYQDARPSVSIMFPVNIGSTDAANRNIRDVSQKSVFFIC